MAAEQFTNDAQTLLDAAGAPAGNLSVTVLGNAGFPSTPQFRVRVDNELMLVTGVSGLTWAVDRGIEQTLDATHGGGAVVRQVLTAGALGALSALTADQPAHSVLAGPAAGNTAAAPGFRALTADDIPVLGNYQPANANLSTLANTTQTGYGLGLLSLANATDAVAAILPDQATHEGQVLTADGNATAWVAPTVILSTNDFRLTTESGVPVSTSDRTAQGTIYLTPYTGNQIALFDGTLALWAVHSTTEIALTLSGLTSGKNYDVFAYWTGSAVALELSAAWTNDTTRANALTRQDGVWVKSGTSTRRLVGTIRTTGTGTTEDSVLQRFVCNVTNLEDRVLVRSDNTIHTYGTTSTWREWNGGTGGPYSVRFVLSVPQVVQASGFSQFNAVTSAAISYGFGVDSTTAPAYATVLSVGTATSRPYVVGRLLIAAGYHAIYALERTDSGSASFGVFSLDVSIKA